MQVQSLDALVAEAREIRVGSQSEESRELFGRISDTAIATDVARRYVLGHSDGTRDELSAWYIVLDAEAVTRLSEMPSDTRDAKFAGAVAREIAAAIVLALDVVDAEFLANAAAAIVDDGEPVFVRGAYRPAMLEIAVEAVVTDHIVLDPAGSHDRLFQQLQALPKTVTVQEPYWGDRIFVTALNRDEATLNHVRVWAALATMSVLRHGKYAGTRDKAAENRAAFNRDRDERLARAEDARVAALTPARN